MKGLSFKFLPLIAYFVSCLIMVKGNMPLCNICKCNYDIDNRPNVDCTKYDANVLDFLFSDVNYMEDDNQTYNIRSLIVQDDNLRTFDKAFPKSKIEILDLSNNDIDSLGAGIFKNVEGLRELSLSFNEIRITNGKVFEGYRVDGMDNPLQSLRIVRLDNNRLHSLHPDTFQHVDRELEEVYLDHNPFKVLDIGTITAISSLAQIKVLSMSYTELKIIPDNFLHTPLYLTMVDLSGNLFEAIPKGLSDSHALETLYFNNNPIAELTEENGFPIVDTITTLHLCNMPNLTKIHKHSLSGLTKLTKLHISNNGALTDIDPAALIRYSIETQLWPKIDELYMRGNKLTTIDSQLLYRWDVLTRLDIRDNAWTCECENQWLLDELMPIMERIDAKMAVGVTCAAPVEMQGKSMSKLSDTHNQMRCLDLFGNKPEKDAKILVGVLIGVLIGVPLVLFLIFAYQRQWFGFFDNSPAAFTRQFYGRTTTEDNMGF